MFLKSLFRAVLRYFLQGLLVVIPLVATAYILYIIFMKIDKIIPAKYPGLGLFLLLVGITAVGFVASSFVAQQIIQLIDKLLNKLPLVKIIYASLKDLLSAFVGDKKKFDVPVLVTMNEQSKIQRIGFITQQDLSRYGLEHKVAVYLPHSYNFSGNFYIVPKHLVEPLSISPSDAMRLVVSGGVVN